MSGRHGSSYRTLYLPGAQFEACARSPRFAWLNSPQTHSAAQPYGNCGRDWAICRMLTGETPAAVAKSFQRATAACT